MKKLTDEVKCREENELKKQPYEKPVVIAVKFFADRVLGEFCFLNPASGCNDGVDR